MSALPCPGRGRTHKACSKATKKTQRHCPQARGQGQVLRNRHHSPVCLRRLASCTHHQSEMAATGPNAPACVTWPAKSTKHAMCGGLSTARGIQHLPAAFNAYGGWGEGILGKLVEPFFNRLRASRERAATGGNRVEGPFGKLEFLFPCTSAAIATEKLCDSPHTAPKLAAQCQHQAAGGKPHRATPKAGLWDEPSQLARAHRSLICSTTRAQQK